MATKAWLKANREKSRAYRRAWYRRNKKYAKDVIQIKRRKLLAITDQIKKRHGCALCPERFVPCLLFHHLDPKRKDINVAAAISRGWTLQRLLAEIAKCVVLCFNCHIKVHKGKKKLAGGVGIAPTALSFGDSAVPLHSACPNRNGGE